MLANATANLLGKRNTNFYLNDYNYFHKNLIKMRKVRKDIINSIVRSKTKERAREPLPKMLTSTSICFYPTSFIKKSRNKSDMMGDAIEHFSLNEEKENKFQTFSTPLFEDLLNCVDNLSINNEEKENLFITRVHGINDNMQEDPIKIKISNVTSVVERIKQKNFDLNTEKPTMKQTLKHTHNLISSTVCANRSPIKSKINLIKCSSCDKNYFTYRSKIKNPLLVYNNIGTFNDKFNSELHRISYNYGTLKSKARFTENPMLKPFWSNSPFGIYKDIRSIENRNADNKLKFKLLPLHNRRKRLLDAVGEKIFKENKLKCEIQKCLTKMHNFAIENS